MRLAATAWCAIGQVVCDRVQAWSSAPPGWRVIGISESPITGPEGNHEFLVGAVIG
jgi:23S rRNA (cytidine1920-2'-O)/16S rRNA (cytidine1409-2'-O)-methyltransferase